MKQKQSPKPLTRSVTVDFGEQVAIKALSIDRFGRLFAIGPLGNRIYPADSKIETGFDTGRPDKPRKVVSQASVKGNAAFHHIDLYLTRFRHILFLDTNTRKIGDDLVSVCSIISCPQPLLLGGNGNMIANPKIGCAIEFRGARVPAEQLGWLYAMEKFDLGNLRGTQSKVAVVTDHDLGNHGTYNTRERDIAGLRKMPPEFELIYGCADRGEHQFVNSLMSTADWHSSRMLDLIAQDPSHLDGMVDAPTDEPFDRFRFWSPQGSMRYLDIGQMKQSLEFHKIPGVASDTAEGTP